MDQFGSHDSTWYYVQLTRPDASGITGVGICAEYRIEMKRELAKDEYNYPDEAVFMSVRTIIGIISRGIQNKLELTKGYEDEQ